MTCTPCTGAAQALDELAGGAAFDVALVDLHMPAMDGLQLALALREQPTGRNLPLVLLSDVQSRLTPQHQSLFDAVLTKPIRATGLRDAVADALTLSGAHLRKLETAGGQRTGDGPAIRVTRPLRVLLAEDNLVNQKVAQLMLGKLGHHVDTVSNGQEALDAVHRAPYDVVLMDVQMPVLDGLATTARIRTELPPGRQPYILALTASALAEDRAACMTAGADAFLSKPVLQRELDKALNAAHLPLLQTAADA